MGKLSSFFLIFRHYISFLHFTLLYTTYSAYWKEGDKRLERNGMRKRTCEIHIKVHIPVSTLRFAVARIGALR